MQMTHVSTNEAMVPDHWRHREARSAQLHPLLVISREIDNKPRAACETNHLPKLGVLAAASTPSTER